MDQPWTVVLDKDFNVTASQDMPIEVYDDINHDAPPRGRLTSHHVVIGNWIFGATWWNGPPFGAADMWGSRKNLYYEGIYLVGSTLDKDNLVTVPTRILGIDSGDYRNSYYEPAVPFLSVHQVGSSDGYYSYNDGVSAQIHVGGPSSYMVAGDGNHVLVINPYMGTQTSHPGVWAVTFDPSDGTFVREDFYDLSPATYPPNPMVLDDPGLKGLISTDGSGVLNVPVPPSTDPPTIVPFMTAVNNQDDGSYIGDVQAYRDALSYSRVGGQAGGVTYIHQDPDGTLVESGFTDAPENIDDGWEDAAGHLVAFSTVYQFVGGNLQRTYSIAYWGDSEYTPIFIDFSLSGELLDVDARFDTGGTP